MTITTKLHPFMMLAFHVHCPQFLPAQLCHEADRTFPAQSIARLDMLMQSLMHQTLHVLRRVSESQLAPQSKQDDAKHK